MILNNFATTLKIGRVINCQIFESQFPMLCPKKTETWWLWLSWSASLAILRTDRCVHSWLSWLGTSPNLIQSFLFCSPHVPRLWWLRDDVAVSSICRVKWNENSVVNTQWLLLLDGQSSVNCNFPILYFLKVLTVSASTTWAGSLFQCGMTRWLKNLRRTSSRLREVANLKQCPLVS